MTEADTQKELGEGEGQREWEKERGFSAGRTSSILPFRVRVTWEIL